MRDKILITTTAAALVLLAIAVGLLFAVWERRAPTAAPMSESPAIVIVDQSHHGGCCCPSARDAHAGQAPPTADAPSIPVAPATASAAGQPVIRDMRLLPAAPVTEPPLPSSLYANDGAPLPGILIPQGSGSFPRGLVSVAQGPSSTLPPLNGHKASGAPEERPTVSVPEPPMTALFASGLVILFLASRRTRHPQ